MRSFGITHPFQAPKWSLRSCLIESWNVRARGDISWRNWGSGWGSDMPGTTQPGGEQGWGCSPDVGDCAPSRHLLLFWSHSSFIQQTSALPGFLPQKSFLFYLQSHQQPLGLCQTSGTWQGCSLLPPLCRVLKGWVMNYASIPSSQAECK